MHEETNGIMLFSRMFLWDLCIRSDDGMLLPASFFFWFAQTTEFSWHLDLILSLATINKNLLCQCKKIQHEKNKSELTAKAPSALRRAVACSGTREFSQIWKRFGGQDSVGAHWFPVGLVLPWLRCKLMMQICVMYTVSNWIMVVFDFHDWWDYLSYLHEL